MPLSFGIPGEGCNDSKASAAPCLWTISSKGNVSSSFESITVSELADGSSTLERVGGAAKESPEVF